MTQPQRFAFEAEFTPSGDVVGGPARKFVPREEVEQVAAKALAEGEARAKATGFAGVDRIVGSLSPVATQVALLAETLRREAAELAMIAARKIAGDALDANGAKTAADAVEQAVRLLKNDPAIVISAAADSLPLIEMRMEQIRRHGRSVAMTFVADPKARPGDWHVEWAEGSVGFNREQVEAIIEAVIQARLQDPVEPQLELFSAA